MSFLFILMYNVRFLLDKEYSWGKIVFMEGELLVGRLIENL